jgi:hypothetical protein
LVPEGARGGVQDRLDGRARHGLGQEGADRSPAGHRRVDGGGGGLDGQELGT